jgi:K+-sensing histidine kinase KdpD
VTDTEAAPSGEVPVVWTRLERGEFGLQDDVASVPDLVGQAIGRLPTADKRDVVSPIDQLPKLRYDFRQELQVLAHVINNAITFSPERQTVEVGAEVNEHCNLVVRVSDSGFGMQNKIRARAFDLFEKFDPAGMDFAEGIGLGLPISRKLMEVHGGRSNSMTISAPV